MAEIPPWLIPADPATFAARGMALGLQASGQRADNAYKAAALQERSQASAADLAASEQAREFEQNFRMQQAARQQQEHAQEMALAQQQQQIAAQAAGKKFEAMQNYENAVKGGMDPNSAILMFGPAMGQSTAEAAVIRANAMRKPPAAPTWQVQTSPTGEKAWVSSAGGIHPITVPKAATAKPSMTDASRWNLIDRTNKEIEKIHEASTVDLSRDEPDPKWNEKVKADFRRMKSSLKALERQRDLLQSGFGGGAPGAGLPPGMEDQAGAGAPDSGGKPALRIVSIEPADRSAGPLMTAGAIRPPAGMDEGSE